MNVLYNHTSLQRSILKYPHFTTIKTLDDECLAPQVSPDHQPPYQAESHQPPYLAESHQPPYQAESHNTQRDQPSGKQMETDIWIDTNKAEYI
ncbi:hypothetical protein E2C01_098535 [Portunus trituberculatus]|uniref:Uncharacterized protein n=1 Tax=Portunus trituberculatus TaxID=210409 RepID=A0A5B7K7X2_PORTR|nr:hypothetical protein [Portunus trituberculatus]